MIVEAQTEIPRLLPLSIAIPLAVGVGLGLRMMARIPYPWLRWLIRGFAVVVLFRTAYEAGEINTLTAAMMFGYGVWTMIEKLERPPNSA